MSNLGPQDKSIKEDESEAMSPFVLIISAIILTIVFVIFSSWMLYENDGLNHSLMKTDKSSKRDANNNL